MRTIDKTQSILHNIFFFRSSEIPSTMIFNLPFRNRRIFETCDNKFGLYFEDEAMLQLLNNKYTLSFN